MSLPEWRLPAGVPPGTWSYVNSRLIADDYVYDGPGLERCVVFRLERIVAVD